MDRDKIEGLWQFQEMVTDNTGQATSSGITDQYTFKISGELITISLLSDQPLNWRSEDDVYLLKTRWQNNTLLYKPPYGKWTPLGDFDGEVFYQSDGQNKRVFKKITEKEVVDWNKPIIKKGRQLFNYDSQE